MSPEAVALRLEELRALYLLSMSLLAARDLGRNEDLKHPPTQDPAVGDR
jgi:hypothetical protein